MRFFAIALLVLLSLPVFAQKADSLAIAPMPEIKGYTDRDSLYREDQFYVSFTYNILSNTPDKVSQNKFSAGFTIGFLRDIPINQQRTISIAPGIGYGVQNFNYNLIVRGKGQIPEYELISDSTYYEKNKLSLNYVEVPIEFRWRNSTIESHKFWRVYTGVKFGYLFHSRSKFVGDGGKTLILNNSDLNRFRYSVYLAGGYNTWNAYIQYGLNPIFGKGSVNGNSLDMSSVNVGLMFYIL